MDPKAVEKHRKELISLVRELYGKRPPKALKSFLRGHQRPVKQKDAA